MGIALIECGDKNDELGKMTCLSSRIFFSVDLLIIIILVYQIRLRIKRTNKTFSRKLIILYLLLIQPISIFFHFIFINLILYASKWDLLLNSLLFRIIFDRYIFQTCMFYIFSVFFFEESLASWKPSNKIY